MSICFYIFTSRLHVTSSQFYLQSCLSVDWLSLLRKSLEKDLVIARSRRAKCCKFVEFFSSWSANLKLWSPEFSFQVQNELLVWFGLIRTRESCIMFLETNSKSIDEQTQPLYLFISVIFTTHLHTRIHRHTPTRTDERFAHTRKSS